ncbi:hypothetical protein GOODEAATRI_009290, partial [Goodea atripinnis]
TSQELGGMVSGYLHFDLKVFSLLAMLSDDVPLPVSSCFPRGPDGTSSGFLKGCQSFNCSVIRRFFREFAFPTFGLPCCKSVTLFIPAGSCITRKQDHAHVQECSLAPMLLAVSERPAWFRSHWEDYHRTLAEWKVG